MMPACAPAGVRRQPTPRLFRLGDIATVQKREHRAGFRIEQRDDGQVRRQPAPGIRGEYGDQLGAQRSGVASYTGITPKKALSWPTGITVRTG